MRRIGFYSSVLARCGARADAEAAAARVRAFPETTWGRWGALAYASLALGDTARGLDAMERAAAGDGDLLLAEAIQSPLYDPVRGSPRFAAVLSRFRLDVARLTAPDGSRSREGHAACDCHFDRSTNRHVRTLERVAVGWRAIGDMSGDSPELPAFT